MKKTYNIPTMNIETFLTESVVTVSGFESNQTTDQKLDEYISTKKLTVNDTVKLVW